MLITEITKLGMENDDAEKVVIYLIQKNVIIFLGTFLGTPHYYTIARNYRFLLRFCHPGLSKTYSYYLILILCDLLKVFNGSCSTPKHQKAVELNYVTFEPFMVSSGGIIGIPLFESLGDTMKRAMAWFNKQGWCINFI